MDPIAIISVDGHVTGSRDAYRGYVERKHLGAYDEWCSSMDEILKQIGMDVLGNLKPEFDPSSQWDSNRRLRDLEAEGIVAEVLFPNGLPFQMTPFVETGQARDPELTRQAQLVYNRWLADFCAQAKGRRAGQALVSFADIDQAVKDVHWAKEHGLAGIMMPPLVPGARYFFDPALDPFWAACQEVGLPVSQHGGSGAPAYSPVGYASIMTLALEHSFFSGRSLWQMIYGGVFERFPDLQLVFVETESDWIGRTIQKMDARLAMGDDWIAFTKGLGLRRPFSRTASEFWAANCHVGLSPFSTREAPIHQIIGEPGGGPGSPFCFGTGRSMFGADYPHFESIVPNTRKAVADLVGDSRVTESDARKVLYENAADVYGFDLAVLQPHFERVGFRLDEIRNEATPA